MDSVQARFITILWHAPMYVMGDAVPWKWCALRGGGECWWHDVWLLQCKGARALLYLFLNATRGEIGVLLLYIVLLVTVGF